jgi:hypothetical protein
MVERLPVKEMVAGSSPAAGASQNTTIPMSRLNLGTETTMEQKIEKKMNNS